jgi:hypothetical protein
MTMSTAATKAHRCVRARRARPKTATGNSAQIAGYTTLRISAAGIPDRKCSSAGITVTLSIAP